MDETSKQYTAFTVGSLVSSSASACLLDYVTHPQPFSG